MARKATKKMATKKMKTTMKATKKVTKKATGKSKAMAGAKLKAKTKMTKKTTMVAKTKMKLKSKPKAMSTTKTIAKSKTMKMPKSKLTTTAKMITSLPSMTAPQQKMIAVPDLTLPATGGQEVNLKQLGGKKVVLYFYPKDMTPGCTIEGHEFTKLKNEFESKNTVVFGVSRDTVELHEEFKEKECYTIDLLSDVDEKLCNAFSVIKDKNMYGKTVRGIERSTFVIDENGQVVKEWRGVKVEGHAQEVLTFVGNKENSN